MYMTPEKNCPEGCVFFEGALTAPRKKDTIWQKNVGSDNTVIDRFPLCLCPWFPSMLGSTSLVQIVNYERGGKTPEGTWMRTYAVCTAHHSRSLRCPYEGKSRRGASSTQHSRHFSLSGRTRCFTRVYVGLLYCCARMPSDMQDVEHVEHHTAVERAKPAGGLEWCYRCQNWRVAQRTFSSLRLSPSQTTRISLYNSITVSPLLHKHTKERRPVRACSDAGEKQVRQQF